MKKTIIILFALYTAFSCAAQTFRMSQLKGCKWVSYELENETNTIWFTDSAYYDESFYPTLNKTVTSKMAFYLSNTIEKVFDESKVGTNTSGKYLIVKKGNAEYGYNLVVCEIMGVSGTTLSIKYNIYSAKPTIGGVKFVQNFTKVQSMASTAQGQIFSVNADGSIAVKPEFIESIDNFPKNETTPYVLKFSKTVNAMQHAALNDNYIVRGLKYNGYTDADPGDFNVIEISYGKDTLFTLKYDDGWENMSKDWGAYTSSFCGIEDLGNNTFAAIFIGATLANEPPYLTIIALKDGKASLVFNKRIVIVNINTASDGSKTFDLQENFSEPIDENTFTNPQKHTLTIKDGNIYFK